VCLIIPVLLLLTTLESHAFQSCAPTARIKTSIHKSTLMFAQDDNDDDKDALDDWLDTPFFDPLAYEDDDDSTWQARLANFVKTDYNAFEFLYAGTFLAFMLVVSQELFRMQLYGADYVPFTSNSQTVNELWKSL